MVLMKMIHGGLMAKEITREKAIETLWRLGELSFKLTEVQKKIYKDISKEYGI